MKANIKLLNTAYKHIAAQKGGEYVEVTNINVLKNEEFGLQLLIDTDKEFTAVIGKYMDISWKGLIDKIRIEVQGVSKAGDTERDCSQYFNLNLVDYVMDDDKRLVADILMSSSTRLATTMDQVVYISGKLPKDFEGKEVVLIIRAFHSKDYDDEKLLYENKINIQVSDYTLTDIKDSDFYMDLWQHPCNWARIYDVTYYGDEHMEIIDNYMKGMSRLGQRVCSLIISDYSWAGQRCYKVEENHENLFELNIIRVKKDEDGNILCDFTAMDKYLKIAQKYGILEEINIFGVLGNWDAYDFGNPLTDYRDPVRVSYYDEKTRNFKYFSSKEELRIYLNLVFKHIQELGLWEKTMIMSDEPNNPILFREAEKLLNEAAGDKKISVKCAIHNQKFLEEYGKNIKSVSLNTCELVNNISKIDEIKKIIANKGGNMTWFSCCFPQDLNIFLKSPLIESRLIGWFTYYVGLDGFLRWAYGIWPGNVLKDASYKKEKWAAGDMFLVYPGKNGKPMESIRLKNIVYGIQDWILLKSSEEIIGKDIILERVEKLLGEKSAMKFVPEREVELNHSLDYSGYMEMRNWMISKLSKFEGN